MSKNFELLQQVGKEQALFSNAVLPAQEGFEEGPATLGSVTAPQLSGGAEEISGLVQRIFPLSSKQASHAVVFTGTESGTGCTWVCARAGEVLANQVSASICLVDANLRAPRLHEQFGVANHHGLSDALLQPEPIEQFVARLSPPNLAILSCGGVIDNARTLLTSNRMSARLAELRSMFDYVLIDASPREAAVLAAAADGLVLVLKANSSRKETVRSAVRDLQAANVKILGAVLNQRTFPIPEGLYRRL
jgi:Mrp family chromosome partitioning ATPase